MIMVVVVTVLLLLIIISLTRVGRRQPDHIYDRHDSADPPRSRLGCARQRS